MIRWIRGSRGWLGWLVGAGHGAELNAHDPLARVSQLLKGPGTEVLGGGEGRQGTGNCLIEAWWF